MKPSQYSAGAIRVGQFYLDLKKRRLNFLNEVGKRLRKEGVPLSADDLAKHPIQTAEGKAATANDLPPMIVVKKKQSADASFMLEKPGKPAVRVDWSASPHLDADKHMIGVFYSICISPPEPDWQALAGLAHDLRTPLNALNLLADLLESPDLSPNDQRESMKDLRAATDRGLRVGMDLLQWCRGPMQPGRGIESGWVLIEPFMQKLIREQKLSASRKGLKLSVDLSAAAGWSVFIDDVRLGRLVANLLVNAVRYTASGQVALRADWRDETKGRVLAIGVVDTGKGISPEEQESIFIPFSRGQAVKDDDSGGSGLGLAVVDRLLAELGLELEVYSEHGRGSAFHLLLPARILRHGTGPEGKPAKGS